MPLIYAARYALSSDFAKFFHFPLDNAAGREYIVANMGKETSSLALPEDWPVCELCAAAGVETRIRPDKRAITHHFNYDPPITATLCFACHCWLHGQGRVFNHPIKRQFPDKDSQKAYAPIVFAYAALTLFESKMLKSKQIYLVIPTPVTTAKGRMDN